jgi:glycosyltransferase involved in cell wall biosynthesis
MQARAQKSFLFQERDVHVIQNSVPTAVFTERDKRFARELHGLPQEPAIVLFGSAYHADWKGFAQLVHALEILGRNMGKDQVSLVTFGARQPDDHLQKIPFSRFHLGYLQDELVACAYAAADVLALPSLEDNLPNMMLESMACGVPVVAYRTGGIPEVIWHQETGLLAPRGHAEEFARQLEWAITHPQERQKMGQDAKRYILHHCTLRAQAEQYVSLYQKLLKE